MTLIDQRNYVVLEPTPPELKEILLGLQRPGQWMEHIANDLDYDDPICKISGDIEEDATAKLIAAAPDIASAYLNALIEIERLRGLERAVKEYQDECAEQGILLSEAWRAIIGFKTRLDIHSAWWGDHEGWEGEER
jgi:hypothetical protein